MAHSGASLIMAHGLINKCLTSMKTTTLFSAADLRQFGQQLLAGCGLAADRAWTVAEVLLEGDLLGHTTHGFALLPVYLQALEDGSMEIQGEPLVVADQRAALTWDGRYLPGPWLVREAIRIAQGRLADSPVVTFVIRRSHHIGCLQAYLKPVTDSGFVIILSCSDPASRTVVPHGGIAPIFSPNPLAAGIPTVAAPILVDMSMSTTANAVCQRWAAENKRAPGPWLVNRAGDGEAPMKNSWTLMGSAWTLRICLGFQGRKRRNKTSNGRLKLCS